MKEARKHQELKVLSLREVYVTDQDVLVVKRGGHHRLRSQFNSCWLALTIRDLFFWRIALSESLSSDVMRMLSSALLSSQNQEVLEAIMDAFYETSLPHRGKRKRRRLLEIEGLYVSVAFVEDALSVAAAKLEGAILRALEKFRRGLPNIVFAARRFAVRETGESASRGVTKFSVTECIVLSGIQLLEETSQEQQAQALQADKLLSEQQHLQNCRVPRLPERMGLLVDARNTPFHAFYHLVKIAIE
ncbi:hypothetical protein ACSSS7_001216 [Eimeria intestinalis]